MKRWRWVLRRSLWEEVVLQPGDGYGDGWYDRPDGIVDEYGNGRGAVGTDVGDGFSESPEVLLNEAMALDV